MANVFCGAFRSHEIGMPMMPASKSAALSRPVREKIHRQMMPVPAPDIAKGI